MSRSKISLREFPHTTLVKKYSFSRISHGDHQTVIPAIHSSHLYKIKLQGQVYVCVPVKVCFSSLLQQTQLVIDRSKKRLFNQSDNGEQAVINVVIFYFPLILSLIFCCRYMCYLKLYFSVFTTLTNLFDTCRELCESTT